MGWGIRGILGIGWEEGETTSVRIQYERTAKTLKRIMDPGGGRTPSDERKEGGEGTELEGGASLG